MEFHENDSTDTNVIYNVSIRQIPLPYAHVIMIIYSYLQRFVSKHIWSKEKSHEEIVNYKLNIEIMDGITYNTHIFSFLYDAYQYKTIIIESIENKKMNYDVVICIENLQIFREHKDTYYYNLLENIELIKEKLNREYNR